jgi:predicted kinase
MNWDGLSAADLDDVLTWAGSRPWARAMAACAQDAGWHAEGDVWTHTKMVCRQLPLLEEWPVLPPHDRAVLLCTALFHDAGKPVTSALDPETGRVRPPKHALKGEHLARGVLRDLGCPLPLREEVARLVRFHGLPAFLLEKPDPEHEVVSLSWLVSNRLLYLFALADTRGRDTGETTRPEEDLRLWRLTAEECGCLGTPYPFANDQARFLYHRSGKPDRFYAAHEDYRCTVTLMSGLPGSGKDTWLSRNRPDLPVISLDDLRKELEVEPTDDQGQVAQLAQERCRELLRSRQDFAFSSTNLLRQTRKRWTDLFAGYGARIEAVYVEPPLPVILDRNRRRDRRVPEDVILRLAGKAEPPTWTEAHAVTVVG